MLLSVATLNLHSVPITVEDDGPGIPSDPWAERLQPQSRGDPSRHRYSWRHGFGLAICKILVECQGGSMEDSHRHSVAPVSSCFSPPGLDLTSTSACQCPSRTVHAP
ncbi:ATP-binding protein [Pseudomonas atacamensis]|uniref:ATP-binding protein n=1 Tax=Pseudomonas atacamensis TaxID=2565368 RepID=UPI003C7DB3F5